jgi:hypothetical protein
MYKPSIGRYGFGHSALAPKKTSVLVFDILILDILQKKLSVYIRSVELVRLFKG